MNQRIEFALDCLHGAREHLKSEQVAECLAQKRVVAAEALVKTELDALASVALHAGHEVAGLVPWCEFWFYAGGWAPKPGAEIHASCREAILLAKILGEPVNFLFNDVELIATEDGDPIKLAESFYTVRG